jgi:ABC-type Na+ efflux pump permease subunit
MKTKEFRFDAVSALMALVVLIAVALAALAILAGIEVATHPKEIMQEIGELGRALVDGFKEPR